MTLYFTQTDTGAATAQSQFCSGTAAYGSTVQNKTATQGGTAGTGTGNCTISAGSTANGAIFTTDAVGASVVWSSGVGNEITFRLNVTTSNADVSITEVVACRFNSSDVHQERYGQWTGSVSCSTTGVKSISLTTEAQNGGEADTDYLVFIVTLTSTAGHGNSAIAISPSEDIDALGLSQVFTEWQRTIKGILDANHVKINGVATANIAAVKGITR